ncbi:hypothetical protein M0R45_003040 [Rubus argutus]|uniref:RING-type E3 ubiquitin transferase n=1 Tax=Rubus argutus TaxID=59490 RepID=A0AAW1YGT3_RUBAR
MSRQVIEHGVYFFSSCGMDWKSVPGSSVDSDDALKIRFRFIKETQHVYGPSSHVLESFYVPVGDKVITIRPSELCSEDTTSIMQSFSMRLIVDFVNTHYPPFLKESMRSKIVTRAIELVQNSRGSFPLPPDRVIVVERCEKVKVWHRVNDEATKKILVSCFEDSKRGTCDICFDDYEVGVDASRLPCWHVFHRACNAGWLPINHTCPVCRYSISPEVVTWF